MIFAFTLMFLAWLLALYDRHLCLRKIKSLRQKVRLWSGRAGFNRQLADEAATQLTAAQKQIIELKRNSPGRDKSGRFVKKPSCFDNHGSG